MTAGFYCDGVRSTPGPTKDEQGRLWVNSEPDRRAEEWLARQQAADGVSVVDPPKPVCVPVTLDGVAQFGEVRARRWTPERGWEGLVLLERQYAPAGPDNAGWWHLLARWLPADQIEVLPSPTTQPGA